jgi:hypothetical protein
MALISDTIPARGMAPGFIDYFDRENHIKRAYNIIIDSGDRDWYSAVSETPLVFHINLQNSLENIITIAIDKLYMPLRHVRTSYLNTTDILICDDAFLLVQLDDVSGANIGSNINTDKCIAAMAPEYSDTKYIEFDRAVPTQFKSYYGSPRARLDKLNITILGSTGDVPHQFRDILEIDRIFSAYTDADHPSSTAYIVVRTRTFFNSGEYLAGDLIKIKGYVFHNMANNECYRLNKFINRPAGHRIINIATSVLDGILYNEINIPLPQFYSTDTGALTYESWYSDFLVKNDFTSITSDLTGKLINTNLQSKLLIHIITMTTK